VSWKNWLRVRASDTKRLYEARANQLDDVKFQYRGQFYRASRSKTFKITLYRRVQDGGTFAESYIKHPSPTMVKKVERLFADVDAKFVHGA
jgi:hypothetical protein